MYVSVCIFIFLVSSCAAVHRDFFRFSNSMDNDDDEDQRVSWPDPGHIETEVRIGSPSSLTSPSLSPRQCCKVGERIGRRQISCDLDVYITTRATNVVYKSKNVRLTMTRDAAAAARSRFANWNWNSVPTYEELGRCHQHRKVFEKCCVHRVSLPRYWIHQIF